MLAVMTSTSTSPLSFMDCKNSNPSLHCGKSELEPIKTAILRINPPLGMSLRFKERKEPNRYDLTPPNVPGERIELSWNYFHTILSRSEERRVGKEWRSRWSPYHLKK